MNHVLYDSDRSIKLICSHCIFHMVAFTSLLLLVGCNQPKTPLDTPPGSIAANACNHTVTANVVALEQSYVYNRFGAFNPHGLIYALRRDVVKKDEGGDEIGGGDLRSNDDDEAIPLSYSDEDKDLAGKVKLRSDKRPRPLVLRVNEGDCLEVTFTNLLAPHEDGQEIIKDPLTGRDIAIESEQPATRMASMHVNGLDYLPTDSNPEGIASDGANVGLNTSSLAAPGETKVYKWLAKKEGGYLFYSMAAPVGGEGDGGQLGLGLFGSINVEPKGSTWYRSQVTGSELQEATQDLSKFNTPVLDYEKLRILDGDLDGDHDTAEILHGDLNVVIDSHPLNSGEPGKGGERCDYERKHDIQSCGKPFREFTAIFHDEITAVQAFPELDEGGMEKLKDGFAINYGASGMGSAVLARRKYDQQSGTPGVSCPECKGEEFFLSSWANGDPALLPEYKDDPSNVHHSYLGDNVRFRNLHAGPKETHVFHLHAHQWVQDKNDPQSVYLDSQTISPGATFSYEVQYGGSGNRNYTPGDSIFHCHLYPHFAQGMWELWRTHDVFEDGSYDKNAKIQDGVASRNLPDYKIPEGTPNPALVPLPRTALPPMPSQEFPGYPFYIAGEKGHRPPQPPLDFAKAGGKEQNGGLPRHLILNGAVADGKLAVDKVYKETGWNCPKGGKGHDDLYECGRKKANMNANSVSQRNGDDGLFILSRTIESARLEILDEANPRVQRENRAMDFHSGNLYKDDDARKAVKLPRPQSSPNSGPSQGKSSTPHDWPPHNSDDHERLPMGYPSCDAEGNCDNPGNPKNRILFHVNGLEPKSGAPYADPCLTTDTGTPPSLRTYKAAYIQFDMTVNKHGWHDPQARIPVLEEDAEATLNGTRAPEPLFFRANSGECVEFQATNLIPSNINLDDFQYFTPTDTMGQHIHLVKFDVTSSDGSGNGWNYEDGTFSPDEVRERIIANNHWAEECAKGKHSAKQCQGVSKLRPQEHRLFTDGIIKNAGRGSCAGFELSEHDPDWNRKHPWCGAQTTVQRWWADPLKSDYYRDASHQFHPCAEASTEQDKQACEDRTLRTVFTHDHFGPSSHQQHGFYAALVVEPDNSLWQSLDGKRKYGGEQWEANAGPSGAFTQLIARKDGGPTSYAANILAPKADARGNCSITQPENCHKTKTSREFGLAFADFATVYSGQKDHGIPDIPVNPPNRKEEELPRAISFKPVPEPEAIAASDPGTQLINYRNEPIPLRIGQCSRRDPKTRKCLSYEQKKGSLGNMANVFSSILHKKKDADSRLLFPPHEKLRVGKGGGMREPGDPATPLLPVYEGDRVQLRLIQGAQEEQHVFTMHGNKWLSQPDSPNSGWTNAQPLGISEHFEFNTTTIQDGRTTDYLYYSSASDNLWDGMWGLMRAYPKCSKGEESNVCLDGSNGAVNPIDSWTYRQLQDLPTNKRSKAGATAKSRTAENVCQGVKPREVELTAHYGDINYNSRFGIKDSDGIWFTETSAPNANKPTASPEPLIMRAAAGECLKVVLKNRFQVSGNLANGIKDKPSWNLVTPIIDGFNFNQVAMSERVRLQPALLSNFSKLDEPEVGLNGRDEEDVNDSGKAAAPGNRGTQFFWYAGLDNFSPDNATDKKPVPVEFGAVTLMDMADVIKHSSHGGVGALVVEPEDAKWDVNCGDNGKSYMQKSQAMKDVCDKNNHFLFREFVVIYQDDLSLQQGGQALPNLRLADDAEDSGQKAFNYGTEPLWARAGLGSPANEPSVLAEHDLSKVFSSKRDSNGNCEFNGQAKKNPSLSCDPATPLFVAKAGTPIRVRVVHPAGHPRQHAFALFGHHWDYNPWTENSTKLWSPYEQNPPGKMRTCSRSGASKAGSSNWVGTEGSIGPGRHLNILTCAGGEAGVPGDYMYRTQETFMFTGGLWGILRVCASSPKDDGSCQKDKILAFSKTH